jgi:hypothetical protein
MPINFEPCLPGGPHDQATSAIEIGRRDEEPAQEYQYRTAQRNVKFAQCDLISAVTWGILRIQRFLGP